MAQTNSKFFSVMVIGQDHEEFIKKYDKHLTVEPYIKFKYLDAEKYQKREIAALEKMQQTFQDRKIDPHVNEWIKSKLKHIKEISSFEYYKEITEGLYYDENGNALSEENKNGKYDTCRIGKHFSMPLKLKDGTESYSALNKDIDWGSMHLCNANVYETAWELCVENREPENSQEETIKEKMGDKIAYFENFKTKEEYVNYNTAYWNYAFVTANEWKDMDSETNGDSQKWINTFFETFVENLQDDDLVTIYECTINNG